MINRRSKGRRVELEAKKMLEAEGWFVLITPPPKKYNEFNDFFHLFDIIAYKNKVRLYIQIKSNRKPNLEEYAKWYEHFANEYESVQVWIRKDGNSNNPAEWIYYCYDKGGWNKWNSKMRKN